MTQSFKYRFYCCHFVLFLWMTGPGEVMAQESSNLLWTIDGNIRYRFEQWDNANARFYGSEPEMGNPNESILLQRIVAGTTIRVKNNITFSVHLQDSRAFGWSLCNSREPDAFKKHPDNSADPYYIMNPHEEFFEIYDASIRVDGIFHLFSLTVGRQKSAFEDYRVYGPGSWGNTGRWTWDAFRLDIEKPRWSGSIWYGGTKIHDPRMTYLPFTHAEYAGGGIHFQIKPAEILRTDLYFAHKHQGSAAYIRDKQIRRNWAGFRLYQPENFSLKYETLFTYEFGEESNTWRKGSGLFVLLGYQMKTLAWKPCVTLRYTYASGNRPETSQNEEFDPVYGAGDRYYGWMNLLKWSNLDDREVMLEIYPLAQMRIELKYNRFRIPDPEGALIHGNLWLPQGVKLLGDEIDLFAKYDHGDNWQFVTALGYFFMKKGRTPESDYPGNAFLISLQVLYRFKLTLS